jgi:hypothetical protein
LKSFLPHQYLFSHKYSLYLNEYLANLLVFGKQNNVYSVLIHPNEQQEKEFSQLEGAEIAFWLENNGYKDELEKMLTLPEFVVNG